MRSGLLLLRPLSVGRKAIASLSAEKYVGFASRDQIIQPGETCEMRPFVAKIEWKLTNVRSDKNHFRGQVGSVPVDGQIKGTCYNATDQNTPPWGGATPVRRPWSKS